MIVRDASGKTVGSLFPAEEFLDYEEQTTVFEDVVGTKSCRSPLYGTSDMGAARLNIAWMTPNGFAFFGVPAAAWDEPSGTAMLRRAHHRWRWYLIARGSES